MYLAIFCQNMKHKSKYMHVSYSIPLIWVELCFKATAFQPFHAKYARFSSSYLKMSGFSSKNVRYPRYQDTDFLQLCKTGGMISDLISFFKCPDFLLKMSGILDTRIPAFCNSDLRCKLYAIQILYICNSYVIQIKNFL